MPKKKIPQSDQIEEKKEQVNDRVNAMLAQLPSKQSAAEAELERAVTPREGDIVQVIKSSHKSVANIAIVHHQEGGTLICYQPGRKGFPARIKLDIQDVKMVGRAHLKYGKPLPDENIVDPSLDKI